MPPTKDNITKLETSVLSMMDKMDTFMAREPSCRGEDCLHISRLSIRQKILFCFVGSFVSILIAVSTWSYVQFLGYTAQADQEQKKNIATMERMIQKLDRAEKDIQACASDRRDLRSSIRTNELDLARLKNHVNGVVR